MSGIKILKILWIGDAVAHTGFATVTHAVLDNMCKFADVHVLGINYQGDPHNYKYPIYPAMIGGDVYGINRLPELLAKIQPDVVCVLNDPWIVKEYVDIIKSTPAKAVCYVPVDSPNMRSDFSEALNKFDMVIGYTKFAIDELSKSGMTAKYSIIPHGVDTSIFNPVSKEDARSKLNMNPDWFIVGCTNRNQPRKRLDLAVKYFAEFAKDKPDNVKFYYHGGLRDQGWDIIQLAQYYGMDDSRLVITSPNITAGRGIPREMMKYMYSSHDVHISTTLGEGFGLTQAESMACGVPQIVPEWSALNEWCRFDDGSPAVLFVPCTTTLANTGGINTIGGVADEAVFVKNLNDLYNNEQLRKDFGKAAFNLITQPKFNWDSISKEFLRIFKSL